MESKSPSTALAALLVVALALLVPFAVLRSANAESDDDALQTTLDEAARDVAAADARAERARQEARRLYEQHVHDSLERHDRELEKHYARLRDSIASYFDGREVGLTPFAEDVGSLRRRMVSVWDSEEHQQDIRDLFNWHVLKVEPMTEHLTTEVAFFLEAVTAEEERLMVRIRDRARTLPALEVTAALDEDAFRDLVDERIRELSQRLRSGQLDAIAGTGAGFAVGALLVYYAAPAAVVGPVGGLAVVKLIVTTIAGIMQSLTMSEDEIREWGRMTLDRLETTTLHGSAEAIADHARLEKISRSDPDATTRRDAERVIEKMHRNGHLGIQGIFGFVKARSLAYKRDVYLSIGGVE